MPRLYEHKIDLEELPKYQKFRLDHKHLSKPKMKDYSHMYSERAKRFWTYLERFMQNSIGVKFDNAFSKYCQSVPETVCGVNSRKEFHNMFDDRGYYVDDEGYIRFNYPMIRCTYRPLEIPGDDVTVYYQPIRFNNLIKQHKFSKKFRDVYGFKAWDNIIQEVKISESDYINILEHSSNLEEFGKDWFKQIYIKQEYKGKLIWSDNPNYWKYWYEWRDIQNKIKRENF